MVGQNFGVIFELGDLVLLGLDEPGATTLEDVALRTLVARSLEAIILALAATLLARRFAALDMTGVNPSSALELTS